MGAIDWGTLGKKLKKYVDSMRMVFYLGTLFGGHVRFVFTIVLFIFIFCVTTTITSFNEIPLDILTNPFKVLHVIMRLSTELFYFQRKSVSAQGQNQENANSKSNQIDVNQDRENKNEFLKTNETCFSQAVSCKNIFQYKLKSFVKSPCPVEDWSEGDGAATVASLKQYLWSIIYMPAALR